LFEDLCTVFPTEDLLPYFIQEKVADWKLKEELNSIPLRSKK